VEDTTELQKRILYQNTACIVVNKLKGEAVEGASESMVNLQKELSTLLPSDTELIEAVHRLDVPVTGCALFALSKDALVFLNDAFAGKNAMPVEKIYWAIVEKPSRPINEAIFSGAELVHWIETNTQKNKSFAYTENAPGRKKASLRLKKTSEGENYLFMEIELLSGRHHQIRAQLAKEGLYIKGDLKYGAKRSEKGGGIRLHARSLSFPDPLNKDERIRVTADPPELDNLWQSMMNVIAGGPLLNL
jgi:23S rRNA pseudouridine1911/1915/1917 synthase